ncbi:MAG: rod shape-determining protein MreC [Candidatus Sulfotelmatobacter sp.]
MESVLGRHRNLIIFLGVLFLQALGLAVQVRRSVDAENTRLIRIWAVDAITPFERVMVWAQTGTGNLWHNYCFLRGVRAENRQLKQQIEKMSLDQVRLNEDAEQAHRLQKLLAFKEQVIAKTVAAQVIGSSGNDLSRSIYIDKGSNEGIATDMAVITAGGIVGKILRVYPSTSLVLMINDQTSGVGAMVEKSRLQGVLKGTPDGAVILERVMSDEQVVPGDAVVSSGGDQIFPKGLPVGTVAKVSPGREMFLKIEVKPAADLNRLEEVLVVTEKQERNEVVDTGVRVRAADILAQRLPSVPEKPVIDAAAAAKASAASNANAPEHGTSGGVKPSTPAGASAKPQVTQQSATQTAKVPNENSLASQAPKKAVARPATGDSTLNTDSTDAAGTNTVPAPTKPPTVDPPVTQPNTPSSATDDPH